MNYDHTILFMCGYKVSTKTRRRRRQQKVNHWQRQNVCLICVSIYHKFDAKKETHSSHIHIQPTHILSSIDLLIWRLSDRTDSSHSSYTTEGQCECDSSWQCANIIFSQAVLMVVWLRLTHTLIQLIKTVANIDIYSHTFRSIRTHSE